MACLFLPEILTAHSELDPRACCTVKICDGFALGGKCYTGCYPKIEEIYPDPVSFMPPTHKPVARRQNGLIGIGQYWQKNAGSWRVAGKGGCTCHPRYKPDSSGDTVVCSGAKQSGNLGNCINNLVSFHCEF